MGMLTGLLFACQVALAFLPNIELVTLLIILYTQLYRKKAFFIIYAFVLLEGLAYGFGLWWFNYLYVWSLLACLVLLVRSTARGVWCLLSGAYGLAFGALCALPYFVTGGVGGGVAYWVMGIPYDLAHCAGNVAACFLLYRPLRAALARCVQWQTGI